jgi:hypothetical protein
VQLVDQRGVGALLEAALLVEQRDDAALVLDQLDAVAAIGKLDHVPLHALGDVLALLELKERVVELLLQLLVGVVDVELLERVDLEVLKAERCRECRCSCWSAPGPADSLSFIVLTSHLNRRSYSALASASAPSRASCGESGMRVVWPRTVMVRTTSAALSFVDRHAERGGGARWPPPARRAWWRRRPCANLSSPRCKIAANTCATPTTDAPRTTPMTANAAVTS